MELEDRCIYLPITLGIDWVYNNLYLASEEELMNHDADKRFNTSLDQSNRSASS